MPTKPGSGSSTSNSIVPSVKVIPFEKSCAPPLSPRAAGTDRWVMNSTVDGAASQLAVVSGSSRSWARRGNEAKTRVSKRKVVFTVGTFW
jgi:hypothetical protein